MSDDEAAAERLKALGHPVRLAIVRALAERSCCCCADVCSRLPLAQSTVSQHLKVLKEAGLVSFRRDGVRSSYVLNPAALRRAARRPGGRSSALVGQRAGAAARRGRADGRRQDAPKVSADRGRTLLDALEPLALYVAVRPAGPEAARAGRLRWRCVAAKIVTVLVPYSFKWATDALTGEGARARLSCRLLLAGAGRCWCSPTMSAASLATALQPAARRALRPRRPARGAPARLPHLRAPPRSVAALPPGAAHRRAVAHHRARHDRHRDDRPLHAS